MQGEEEMRVYLFLLVLQSLVKSQTGAKVCKCEGKKLNRHIWRIIRLDIQLCITYVYSNYGCIFILFDSAQFLRWFGVWISPKNTGGSVAPTLQQRKGVRSNSGGDGFRNIGQSNQKKSLWSSFEDIMFARWQQWTWGTTSSCVCWILQECEEYRNIYFLLVNKLQISPFRQVMVFCFVLFFYHFAQQMQHTCLALNVFFALPETVKQKVCTVFHPQTHAPSSFSPPHPQVQFHLGLRWDSLSLAIPCLCCELSDFERGRNVIIILSQE